MLLKHPSLCLVCTDSAISTADGQSALPSPKPQTRDPDRRHILHQQRAKVLNDLGSTPDVNGNRTSVTEQLAGSTLTTQYQYDPLQRLQRASYPAIPAGPAAQTVDSSLDAAGNRLNDPSTSSGLSEELYA